MRRGFGLGLGTRPYLGAGLMLALLPGAPALATTFMPQHFTCPIGGEKFDAQVMGSNTTFGARPDGMPYSPMPIYPLVICPGNGFILFDGSFTPAETAELTAAVASPEFQALRTSDTSYYRAWWLMRRIGRDPHALASTLLQASWEAEGAQKARYQAEFVVAVRELKRDNGAEQSWLWLNLRAANALRELGRFDEVPAVLKAIDKPELLPAAPEQYAGVRRMIDGLRVLAAEGNRASEPATLIPRGAAVERCREPGLTASEEAFCGDPANLSEEPLAEEPLAKEPSADEPPAEEPRTVEPLAEPPQIEAEPLTEVSPDDHAAAIAAVNAAEEAVTQP